MTPQNSLEREARRQRIILSQSQKDTLCAWFEKNPYPDLAARESMAREMGISESQILTWFQKHRRLKQRESECFFRKNQPQGQAKAQFKTQEARRTRTHFTRCQINILIQAFNENRFPGIATRENLARQTGLPESRIQIWFQNRRSRHPEQSQGRPMASLAKGPNQSPPEADQQTQSIQGGGRDPRELTDLATLPLRVSPQPLPGNQPLQHQDEYFFLHFWDEWFQSFIAEWEPEKGYYWSPGQSEIQEIQVQSQSPENSSQLSQEAQQHQV
ncbi:double homeobox protein B-like [Dipodomys spectabilis]|uniref:double homeobox protein B-like n=1 Tax=Dipodomys spectabilis TaxID=105255 RepID=UPI001C544363|nr:double homeobox protein B-like [Dipodomys spectabilis]